MNLQKEVSKPRISLEEFNELIVKAIQEKKGENIVKLDLRKLEEGPTDFFIVCQGSNHVQVQAIADNVVYEIKKKANQLPNHVEGMQNATWVLVDFFNVVVHVFHPEARGFYRLEALWNDAEITEYQNL